jgi:CTP:molybdopterin cytidylyltransferase MocA
MIAAIVLAGGASRRMGTPKALLPFRGSSFLEVVLASCRGLGLAPVVAVVGPDVHKLLSNSDLGDATLIRNPVLESGPIGSIRLGIEAVLNRPVEAAVVWHVDRPHVRPETVARLVQRYREGGPAIVVPGHGDRRGHPVLFGRTVFDELLVAPEHEGARAVVRADPSRVAVVPVDDPAVLEDVDTPEAYGDLRKREDAG